MDNLQSRERVSEDYSIHTAIRQGAPKHPKVTLDSWCSDVLRRQGYTVSEIDSPRSARPPQFTVARDGDRDIINISVGRCAMCHTGEPRGPLCATISPSAAATVIPTPRSPQLEHSDHVLCRDAHLISSGWEARERT